MRRLAALLAAALLVLAAGAGAIAPRAGWAVRDTGHACAELLGRLKEAVKAEGMIVVAEASPT